MTLIRFKQRLLKRRSPKHDRYQVYIYVDSELEAEELVRLVNEATGKAEPTPTTEVGVSVKKYSAAERVAQLSQRFTAACRAMIPGDYKLNAVQENLILPIMFYIYEHRDEKMTSFLRRLRLPVPSEPDAADDDEDDDEVPE